MDRSVTWLLFHYRIYFYEFIEPKCGQYGLLIAEGFFLLSIFIKYQVVHVGY